MFKRSTLVLGLLLSLFYTPATAQADELEELKEQVKQLTDMVLDLQQKVEQYEKREAERSQEMEQIKEDVAGKHEYMPASAQTQPAGSLLDEAASGLEFSAGVTSVFQGTHNANGDDLSQNGEDSADASYSVDLELYKKFGDFGAGYLLAEAGQGFGVDDELRVFSPVNYDATGGDAGIEIVEGWYEHYFGAATLTAGKLDSTIYIDTNAYANDEAAQFLGSIFRNNPTIEFPDSGAGLRLAYAPLETVELESLITDGNGDWEDVFDNSFYAGQVNVKPRLLDRDGNYRVYAWKSTQDHTRFNDSTLTEKINYGFGLSFDQEVTDIIGLFARYGHQNPEVFLSAGDSINLEDSYSIGFQLAGKAWGRDNDVFGLGFGQVMPSNDYKTANTGIKADTESHIETYYNIIVNDYLSLSPVVHVIMDPYGNDAVNGDKTILVGGIRSQLTF